MTGLYFNSETYVFLVQILVKYVRTVNTLNFGLYATKDLFWSFFFLGLGVQRNQFGKEL